MKLKSKIKVQYIDKIPKEKKAGLYYYDIRNADFGNGYTIEKIVIVNNIGSLVSDTNILKNKDKITDLEYDKLEKQEVFNLITKECEEEVDLEV